MTLTRDSTTLKRDSTSAQRDAIYFPSSSYSVSIRQSIPQPSLRICRRPPHHKTFLSLTNPPNSPLYKTLKNNKAAGTSYAQPFRSATRSCAQGTLALRRHVGPVQWSFAFLFHRKLFSWLAATLVCPFHRALHGIVARFVHLQWRYTGLSFG